MTELHVVRGLGRILFVLDPIVRPLTMRPRVGLDIKRNLLPEFPTDTVLAQMLVIKPPGENLLLTRELHNFLPVS